MKFLKGRTGRWAVPTALAAVLAAGLLVTPVIGAVKGLTAKKVNKTIAKKTNVTQLTISGVRNVGTASTTLGTLELNRGNYLVSTTFDARRGSLSENVACTLRVSGVGQDSSSSFSGGAASAEDSVAMEVAGRAGAATTATLSCTSSNGTGQVNHAEITALKVPIARVISG
jgi:hypothetical protein